MASSANAAGIQLFNHGPALSGAIWYPCPQTEPKYVAALALLGSLDQARDAANTGLAINPRFTIRLYREGASSSSPIYLAERERIYEGMRMAGIPEG